MTRDYYIVQTNDACEPTPRLLAELLAEMNADEQAEVFELFGDNLFEQGTGAAIQQLHWIGDSLRKRPDTAGHDVVKEIFYSLTETEATPQ